MDVTAVPSLDVLRRTISSLRKALKKAPFRLALRTQDPRLHLWFPEQFETRSGSTGGDEMSSGHTDDQLYVQSTHPHLLSPPLYPNILHKGQTTGLLHG